MRYVSSGRHSFDETDDLAASISAVLRGRDELGYTSDDELKGWLTDAGIEFDEAQFNLAVGQLERLGRLQTPRTWERTDMERPTWLVDAVPYTGD